MQLADDIEDLLDQDRSQAHGRLVQHQQLRLGHHCTAHGKHLLLAAGERTADLLPAFLQTREQLVDVLQIALNGAVGAGISAHFEVFLDGHVREHTAAFRALRQAQLHDLVGGHGIDRRAHEVDRAGFCAQQTGDRIQDSALAGAVRADQRNDLAFVDLKGNTLDGVDRTIVDVNIIDGKQHVSALLLFAEVRFDDGRVGLDIIGHMRKRMDDLSAETHLNFSLLATPAEGLSGRFVRMDRERFGSIEGVTDREYYTNSFHIPVYYNIGAFDKIKLEAPYHALTNAGHISYVELDGDPLKNLDAFEKIVRCMKESGIGYGSINHPVDRDPVCGFTGIIDNECPHCGRKEFEDGEGFERIRRITGYLVGTMDHWNSAKTAEEADRVKHGVREEI